MFLDNEGWQHCEQDDAAEHGQHPPEIKKNLPDAYGRKNSAKHFDGRIADRVDELNWNEPETARAKIPIEHAHPVKNEAYPQHPHEYANHPEQSNNREGKNCHPEILGGTHEE